jgi:hypothetical protein
MNRRRISTSTKMRRFTSLRASLKCTAWAGSRRRGRGEALFLPRNQAHAWYVMSPKIRALTMTNPGGMDEYFEAMSSPATGMELPPAATTYALADPALCNDDRREIWNKNSYPYGDRRVASTLPGVWGATIPPESLITRSQTIRSRLPDLCWVYYL